MDSGKSLNRDGARGGEPDAVQDGASLYDAGKACSAEASAAKYLAGEACCLQAVLTHSGFGCARVHVEGYLRESFGGRIAAADPVLHRRARARPAEVLLGGTRRNISA